MAPAARWAEHRVALVQAAAEEVVASGAVGVTVDRVTRRARRGRNTFYAHFRDVEQLLRAVESTVLSRVAASVELALTDAFTPESKLRALARSWLEVSDGNPEAFRAMLLVGAPQGSVSSRARDLIRQELRRVLEDAKRMGAISAPLDELRLAALAGAWDGALRIHAERQSRHEAVVETLVDLTMRAFR